MPAPKPPKWPVPDAWAAAVAAVAVATGVEAGAVAALAQGRGPRPPREAWEPRKLAVHLAVDLADCDYAQLGRIIGLHRDTIASHCAAVREACMDNAFEAHVERIALLARFRLECDSTPLPVRTGFRRSATEKLAARVAALEAEIRRLSSSDNATHPTTEPAHENVIPGPWKGAAAIP